MLCSDCMLCSDSKTAETDDRTHLLCITSVFYYHPCPIPSTDPQPADTRPSLAHRLMRSPCMIGSLGSIAGRPIVTAARHCPAGAPAGPACRTPRPVAARRVVARQTAGKLTAWVPHARRWLRRPPPGGNVGSGSSTRLPHTVRASISHAPSPSCQLLSWSSLGQPICGTCTEGGPD
jgi:hypothetical protein